MPYHKRADKLSSTHNRRKQEEAGEISIALFTLLFCHCGSEAD